MAKTKRDKWGIPSEDVLISGGASGVRKRNPGKHSCWHPGMVWEGEVVLRHRPTTIEVKAPIPKGEYSDRQLKEIRAKLTGLLWPILEDKVARHLRIAGR